MPVIWTNARDDANLLTAQGLGLKLQTQLNPVIPLAVKIDASNCSENNGELIDFLKNYSGFVVLDNVNEANSFLWCADILILNTCEAESILKCSINSDESIREAAKKLLSLGPKSILILGSPYNKSEWFHDYWTDGLTSFWLTQDRVFGTNYLETRSILSMAITALLALGYSLADATIIAKMYVHQAIRLAQITLYYGGFPEDQIDMPYLASRPLQQSPHPFIPCHHLGLYPIVDSFAWVELLLQLGVKTIQLRIKEKTMTLEEDICQSIALAKKYGATLFINDHWELALKFHADAVHLGQSDLDTADIEAIRKQGLLLGISTHCYYEVARAHSIGPSYVAIGPIYPTTSKEMPFSAQGIACLQRWRRTLNYPLVAIGGINAERMPNIVATGVDGVALISAITHAEDPHAVTQHLLSYFAVENGTVL